MLTERRYQIFVKSLFIETMELWTSARQPASRIPTEIVAERLREYFRWRLCEALESLWFDSEPLRDVLDEILLVASGQEQIINWTPPALAEVRTRITEPLASYTYAAER
jgi:hypothetical protein